MSPEDLVKALSMLPKRDYPALVVGPDTLDDAGVVKLRDDLALVQTVDFFPPIVDDPSYFGRIAAANALSDVFAMGGKPLSALSIVGWPDALPPELLGEIMRGGQEKLDEAECILAGGHTVTDQEVKYGLAVTGTIHPDKVLTNGGAKAGEVLVLTKRLGMGAISTGIKKGKVGDDIAKGAMDQMAELNRKGADVAVRYGLRCATDVTGFGLAGHCAEIAAASELTVEIDAGALPAFDQALELISKNVISGGAARTRGFLGARLEIQDGVDRDRMMLALDAETSGGLVLSCPEDSVDGIVRDLGEAGTSCAVVIGRVVEHNGVDVRLRP